MQQQNTFWFFAWRWNFSAVSSSSSSVYSWHCVMTLWFLRNPSATGLNILCAGLYSMTLKCLSLQWMSGLQRSPGDVTSIMEVLACKNFLNEQPLWLLLCPLNKTPANLALTKNFVAKLLFYYWLVNEEDWLSAELKRFLCPSITWKPFTVFLKVF